MGKSQPERNQRILNMREEGLTLVDIGREFGVSRKRVHQIVRVGKIQNERKERFAFLGDDPPIRLMNALEKMGVTSLEELQAMSDDEMLQYPNFGRKSFNWLKEKGLRS